MKTEQSAGLEARQLADAPVEQLSPVDGATVAGHAQVDEMAAQTVDANLWNAHQATVGGSIEDRTEVAPEIPTGALTDLDPALEERSDAMCTAGVFTADTTTAIARRVPGKGQPQQVVDVVAVQPSFESDVRRHNGKRNSKPEGDRSTKLDNSGTLAAESATSDVMDEPTATENIAENGSDRQGTAAESDRHTPGYYDPDETVVQATVRRAKEIPRLKPDQIVELSAQINAGLAADKKLKSGAITDEAEAERLRGITETGQSAHNRFFEANMRLVMRPVSQNKDRGVSEDDLMQEGFIGLHKAIDGFKPELGFEFSTYAVPAIRQEITSCIAKSGHPTRLPRRAQEQLNALRHIGGDLLQKLQREPTAKELSDAYNKRFLAKTESEDEQYIANSLLDPDKVDRLFLIDQGFSLNEDEPNNNGTEKEKYLLDEDAIDPEEHALASHERARQQRILRESFDRLTKRQQDVLTEMFGLDGQEPKTGAELSAELGVHKNAIYSVRNSGIRKLRKLGLATLREEVEAELDI